MEMDWFDQYSSESYGITTEGHHASLALPSSANEALIVPPIELPKDNNERLLRFPACLRKRVRTS